MQKIKHHKSLRKWLSSGMYQKLHRVSQFSDFPSKAASGCWCILWNIRKIVTYFFCCLLLLQLLIYSNNFLNGDFNAILFHVCALFSVLLVHEAELLPKWNWPFSVCKLEIVYGGLILKFRGINMAKATFVCPIDAIFWYNREESLDKIEPESCLKRLVAAS